MKTVRIRIKNFTIANDRPLVFIGGPDSLESEEHALKMAHAMAKICKRVGLPYVFKASYDKANRTSVKGFRGVGQKNGLAIMAKIRKEVGVPVTTDFHTAEEAKACGKAVDILQVPALLSRQTDMILAAARCAKIVNVKKGQFVAPHDVRHILEKAAHGGNRNVILTERGYMFGYNNVVADMRSLEIMKRTGHPVVFDAAHTAQTPSAAENSSGGDRSLIPALARAAVAVGIAGLFIEVHDDPDNAPVDGPSSLRLDDLEKLLRDLKKIDRIAKGL
jgi:2-dehydro-3-deoxyphosphooctonate aldolase (KDO 8-P synthase)